jgi:molybdate transport system substrate-binding protein
MLLLPGYCWIAQSADGNSDPPRKGLTVRSGGHVRKVLEELLPAFEEQTGIRVTYVTGSSGEMLNAALTGRKTDVYIVADLQHVRRAEELNIVAAKLPLAKLRLAIAVRKGNPLQIGGLRDLARSGLRVYVESPAGCQVGGATQRVLRKNNIEVTEPNVTIEGRPPTLQTLDRFLGAGLLDAALVWDSMARRLTDQADLVPIPEENTVTVSIVAVLFRFAPNRGAAERLLVHLRSDECGEVWERHGFRMPRRQ